MDYGGLFYFENCLNLLNVPILNLFFVPVCVPEKISCPVIFSFEYNLLPPLGNMTAMQKKVAIGR